MAVSTHHPLNNNFRTDANTVLATLIQGTRTVSHTKDPESDYQDYLLVSFAYEGIKISLPVISIGNKPDGKPLRNGMMLIPANASTEEILSTLSSGELEIRENQNNASHLTMTFNNNGIKIMRPVILPTLEADGTYMSDSTMNISPENRLPHYLGDCLTRYELTGTPDSSTVFLELEGANNLERAAIRKTLADYFSTTQDKGEYSAEVTGDTVMLTGRIEEISLLFKTLATPELEDSLCRNAQKNLESLAGMAP
jgi:hypothetical protein